MKDKNNLKKFLKGVAISLELWPNRYMVNEATTTGEKNMSTIIDDFNYRKIAIRDNVYGRLFDNGEFRPLDDENMGELYNAGLADKENLVATEKARQEYAAKAIAEYIEAQKNRTEEQIAEERNAMRAAFGAGEEVVNIFTGEVTIV